MNTDRKVAGTRPPAPPIPVAGAKWQRDLFVSYSSRDFDLVKPFHDDLISEVNRWTALVSQYGVPVQ